MYIDRARQPAGLATCAGTGGWGFLGAGGITEVGFMTIPNTQTERKPRRRVAVGPDRPQYLESRDLDKVMMMLVALMSEVSAMRDRLDTHEGLAEQGAAPTRGAVEAFALDPETAQARDLLREQMMKRVFRVLLEETEGGAS
jgi:hypothetical protein